MKTTSPLPIPSSPNSRTRFRLLPRTLARAGMLAACLTLGLAMLTQSARAQATKLVGQWLAGATTFNDISGYAPTNTHDGYLVGGTDAVFTSDVPPGKTGQSLFFNVGDTGLAISNSSTLDASYVNTYDDVIANAFTVTFWAKGWPGAWNPWVSKYGEGSQFGPVEAGWQARTDGSFNNGATYSCFSVRDGMIGTPSTTTTATPNANPDDMCTRLIANNDGNWHFYAGAFNATNGLRSWYVDGLLAAQESNNVADELASTEHLCIGAKDSPPGNTFANYFTGEIYDVRIYDIDLSQSQLGPVMGNVPPGIIGQPASTALIAGTTNTLSPGAVSGPAPLYYQWQLDGTNLINNTNFSGVTSNVLTILKAQVSDAGTYQLFVTNAYGVTASSNAIITIQVPLAAPVSGSYGAVVLTNGPLAFWQLDETNSPSTGTLLAYDYTGHGYNGAYGTDAQNAFVGYRSPQPNGSPAYPGFATNQGALVVTASDENSEVTVPALNLGTNLVDTTICLWFFPYAEPATFTGLFFNRTTDAAGIGFSGTQNATTGLTSLGYTWNNSAGSYNWNSGLFPQIDNWSFAALVVQSNQAVMYLDYIDQITGQTVLSSATNINTQTRESFGGVSYIGGDPEGAARTFGGVISDVAVFHSALNSGQILHLFGEGLGVSGIAPSVTAQPPATYAFAGATAQMSATVAGTTPLYFQWQLNGVNLANNTTFSGVNTNTLTISNVVAGDQGSYSLIITNEFGRAVSSNATLAIQSPSLVGEWLNGTTASTNLSDVSGYSPKGTHDGYLVGGPDILFTNDAPLNQTGVSLLFNVGDTGIAISNSSTLDPNYVNTYDNAIDGAFTVTCWAKGFPGAWNPWVSKWGESEGGWQLRAYNAGPDSAFTVRDNNAGGGDLGGGGDDMQSTFPSANNNWHLYAGVFNSVTGRRSLYVDGVLAADETNNVPYTMAGAEHLCIGAKDSPPGDTFGNYFTGEIYDVRVYNYALAQTNVVAILGNIPPAVNGQPPSITAYVGFTASIVPTGIAGSAPLYYQWQFNGTNLTNGAGFSGVNSSTLTLINVTTNDAGSYSLVMTNTYGQTVSSNAVVTTAFPYLIGNWLDGATNFNDSSGYALTNTHDGYLVGSTNIIWTNDVPAGRSGYSAYFNKGNTGLAISNSSTLDANYVNDYDNAISGAFTVMTWAKGWPGSWNSWVSKYGENAPESGWQLRTDGSGTVDACFTVRNGGVGTVTLGAAVYGSSDDMATRSISIGSAQNGVWHHYAGVFDSVTGNRSLYIDGVLAAHEAGNVADIVASAEHLCICAKDSPSGNNFGNYSTMRLYDVRIYNYPLTQTQVQVAAELAPAITDTPTPPTQGGGGEGSYYGGPLVLTWPYGTLEVSTNLSNPVWTRLTNTSPYTIIMTNQQMYFRISDP